MKKHFEILDLEEGASQAEIKAAYNSLSKKLNPANNDNQDFFKEEYKKVQAAYKALYNTSILATEQGAENDSKGKVFKNSETQNEEESDKDSFQKLKKIKNYLVNFLISLYMIFHSGISLSYLFGLDDFNQFRSYSSMNISEGVLFIGLSISFFLFLVYRFFYSTPLKKMFNYSLVFNLVFMILYIYFHSKSIVTTI